MISDLPTLSVVIPSYNASGRLSSILQAIIGQSLQPFEVIVVDDGSADNSVEIIENICRRFPNMKLLRNERNMGVVYTGQRGLQTAVGDYVYFASTSDRVLPGFFARSMGLLARHPQAALSCSDFVIFYSHGPRLVYRLGWGNEPSFLSPSDLASVIRREGGYIPGATSIIKKSALLDAGGFIPELRGHCDWFVSLVAGFRHGVCYLPEPLAAFRMAEPGSYSSAHGRWTTQREVIKHLFILLQSSQFRDVAPLFKSSAALSCLPHILRGLFTDTERWDYLSRDLVQRALQVAIRRWLLRMTPLAVKGQILRLRKLGGNKDHEISFDYSPDE